MDAASLNWLRPGDDLFMKIAALFPGQGSQSVGMGREFIVSNESAREIAFAADRALGFELTALCENGPIERLTLTEYAQPAILTVSYLAYCAAGITPQAGAGHSLGEYTALVAAKVISFTDAVQLVHKRGRYMQEAVKPGEGKMVAVMGPDEAEIKAVIESTELHTVQIANINSPGQIVIAGDAKGVDAFCAEIGKRGAKTIPLNVSAPFHCALMEPAAQALSADLDAISFSEPAFPVYANVTAKPVSSGADARLLLKQQVCAAVRWSDSMQNLIRDKSITHAVEFGAGGVLTKLLKRINKEVQKFEVSTPETAQHTRSALAL